jgi:uncharacterized protein (DUF302 family)
MKTLRVKTSADEAARILTEAVAGYPMGLVAHINGQQNCAKKGLAVPADQILEVFRPDFAIRVWKAEKAAGIDIPLRIYVYEADGETVVTHRTASETFAPYDNPELMAIAKELEPIFDTILASLEPVTA